jgi:mannose-6-phosphate isomerase-like protein (cupin superfamily)
MQSSLVGIEVENGGVLMKFVQTSAETGGALHAQEARYPAHSKPPPSHCHPKQEERFVIIEGGLHFRIGSETRVVHAGDEVEVPRGVFHRAHNPHAVPALVVWETRPALRTAEFFLRMSEASRGKARPSLPDAAAILLEYQDEFQPEKPPALVQRIVLPCLALFAKPSASATR